MSAAKKSIHGDKQPNSPTPLDDISFDNPFLPTRRQIALFAISLMIAIERHANEHLLPFELGLVCGIIPPECLIWSFIILEMGVKDMVQLWC